MRYYEFMLKRADAELDKQIANHLKANPEYLGKVSPEEIAWTVGGAGLGGLGAYLLSSALAPKAQLWKRLLHTGIGAGVGALGTHVALDSIENSDGMSARESYRGGRDPEVKRLIKEWRANQLDGEAAEAKDSVFSAGTAAGAEALAILTGGAMGYREPNATANRFAARYNKSLDADAAKANKAQNKQYKADVKDAEKQLKVDTKQYKQDMKQYGKDMKQYQKQLDFYNKYNGTKAGAGTVTVPAPVQPKAPVKPTLKAPAKPKPIKATGYITNPSKGITGVQRAGGALKGSVKGGLLGLLPAVLLGFAEPSWVKSVREAGEEARKNEAGL